MAKVIVPQAKVTVLRPGSGTVLFPGQSLRVSGGAVGRGGPEPTHVEGMTVSFDGGSPVPAHVTIVPKQKVPTVLFDAQIQAPASLGPHTITAVATYDDEPRKTASVPVHVLAQAPSPRESLQISVVNPPTPAGANWAADIVKQNRSSFPLLPSLLQVAVFLERGDDYPVCAREWNQVVAPTEDYDSDPVGFTGWLLQPEISGGDVPFTHPFGLDWECMVALDQEYAGLLAPGNAVPDGADGDAALTDAQALSIPVPAGGLLAVETDSANVPSALKPPFGDRVRIGDRIAVFGRWIVDAGHHVPTTVGDSYRAEVHPPMLMAIGGTRPGEEAGETLTRIVVTSRPYLVTQVYTIHEDTIYDDSAPNDGTLLDHLNNEVGKLKEIIPGSKTIEAHPKIASKPFDGVHLFRLSIRPAGGFGGIGVSQVQVSFQFTCRTGVGVTVLPVHTLLHTHPGPPVADDHVDLLISLNSVDYQAPPLPPRQTDTWDKDRLNSIAGGDGDIVSFEQFASLFTVNPVSLVVSELALAHGIDTDKYDVPDVDALDRSHAVPFVQIDQIPAGQGIVIDDNQPYPVVGFLEIRKHHADVVFGH
jgi:hypothetical protein